MTEPIQWAKGGEARVVAFAADGSVTLRSTIPSPPGSRIEGVVGGDAPLAVRFKVHGAKRQEDGSFVLDGRVLDLTRELRARLLALATPSA
jgi:hypothetical protein